MSSSTRYSVVIDTNVIISGLVFGGLPKQVMECVFRRTVTMLLSPQLEHEIVRKFRSFSPTPEIYSELQILIERYSKKIVPTTNVATSRDPKDDILLALALAGHAQYVISGDKDLLVLRRFGDTKIITPRQFVSGFALKVKRG